MTDELRGEIVACDGATTVETQHGERRLAELRVRPTDGTPTGGDDAVDVTLWGKWADTAADAETGMDLLLTDPEEGEYHGSTTYSTGGDSYVVLEPDFIVDVTSVRSWVQCPRMYYLNNCRRFR